MRALLQRAEGPPRGFCLQAPAALPLGLRRRAVEPGARGARGPLLPGVRPRPGQHPAALPLGDGGRTEAAQRAAQPPDGGALRLRPRRAGCRLGPLLRQRGLQRPSGGGLHLGQPRFGGAAEPRPRRAVALPRASGFGPRGGQAAGQGP